LRPKTI